MPQEQVLLFFLARCKFPFIFISVDNDELGLRLCNLGALNGLGGK